MLPNLQEVENGIIDLNNTTINNKYIFLVNNIDFYNNNVVNNYKNYFDDFLLDLLRDEYYDEEYKIYYDTWYNVFNDIIVDINDEKLNISKKKNRNDTEYRDAVNKMYYNCQVTNTSPKLDNLDVAHIHEFKNCRNNYDRYNKFNGLVLRSDIHRTWDAGNNLKLCYDDNTSTIFFKVLTKEFKEKYLEFLDNDGNIPVKIKSEYYVEYKKYIIKRNNI
jgi:hypothetical protein